MTKVLKRKHRIFAIMLVAISQAFVCAAPAFSASPQPEVLLDFSIPWDGTNGRIGVWDSQNSYPGTIAYKVQTGGGMYTQNGKLIVNYLAPASQSLAQSLLIKLQNPMNEMWVQLRFRFQNWHWGNGPSDSSAWYTKLYRLWDLDDANPSYTENGGAAIHYALFGFSSSKTANVMHPFYNVTASAVPSHPKGSAGGPHMAFRHYPYPVPAGTTPPISSGYPEAVFGPIAADGSMPGENNWFDTLVHIRSATPGNDDGLHEIWVNGVAIDPSVPGPEIRYNYGAPTNRVNFPSEGNFDHIVLLDNTAALYGSAAAGAKVEVDLFAVYATDPRQGADTTPPAAPINLQLQ